MKIGCQNSLLHIVAEAFSYKFGLVVASLTLVWCGVQRSSVATHRLAVAVGNVICSFKCVQLPCMIAPSFCLTGAVGTKPRAKIGPGIVRRARR